MFTFLFDLLFRIIMGLAKGLPTTTTDKREESSLRLGKLAFVATLEDFRGDCTGWSLDLGTRQLLRMSSMDGDRYAQMGSQWVWDDSQPEGEPEQFKFNPMQAWLQFWTDELGEDRIDLCATLDHTQRGENIIRSRHQWAFRFNEPVLKYIHTERLWKVAQDAPERLWFVEWTRQHQAFHQIVRYSSLTAFLMAREIEMSVVCTAISLQDIVHVMDMVPEQDPADRVL